MRIESQDVVYHLSFESQGGYSAEPYRDNSLTLNLLTLIYWLTQRLYQIIYIF